MRLISICPSNTEMLEYLGLIDHVVAVDDFSDWPNEVNNLPRLGPDLSIDMDKLESFNPDLVVASLSVPGMERNVEALKERNIPHIVLNPNSLEDIANDLLALGKATNTLEQATIVVGKFKNIINEYQNLSKSIEKKSYYWEWWPKPVFTPGKKNWLTEISALAGGYNLFSDKAEASIQTTWADVHSRNPDRICLVWVGVKQEKMNPKLIRSRPGWSDLPAVKDDKIYILEEQLFCRPSPRLLLGLKKLATTMHPSHFPVDDGIDPLK
ncbi:cobalamin-binding protein [Bacillus sp. FJAT-45350]|uniref:cobalamin-binding protein n=1 Tax=Bacillus sp. FJAT-45350 TaxID=2011014 RepID=UPI000BB6904F|nr:cobalamin-binding protein [Bacillus sp. FJAT-45350]